jgi:hypothetical protein
MPLGAGGFARSLTAGRKPTQVSVVVKSWRHSCGENDESCLISGLSWSGSMIFSGNDFVTDRLANTLQLSMELHGGTLP